MHRQFYNLFCRKLLIIAAGAVFLLGITICMPEVLSRYGFCNAFVRQAEAFHQYDAESIYDESVEFVRTVDHIEERNIFIRIASKIIKESLIGRIIASLFEPIILYMSSNHLIMTEDVREKILSELGDNRWDIVENSKSQKECKEKINDVILRVLKASPLPRYE